MRDEPRSVFFPSECLRHSGRRAVVGSSPACSILLRTRPGHPLDEMGYRRHDHRKPEKLWMKQFMKLLKNQRIRIRPTNDVVQVGVPRVLPLHLHVILGPGQLPVVIVRFRSTKRELYRNTQTMSMVDPINGFMRGRAEHRTRRKPRT